MLVTVGEPDAFFFYYYSNTNLIFCRLNDSERKSFTSSVRRRNGHGKMFDKKYFYFSGGSRGSKMKNIIKKYSFDLSESRYDFTDLAWLTRRCGSKVRIFFVGILNSTHFTLLTIKYTKRNSCQNTDWQCLGHVSHTYIRVVLIFIGENIFLNYFSPRTLPIHLLP